MSYDAPIKLKNAKGETIFEYPDEASMLVSRGGFVAPDGCAVGSGSARPVSDALPRFEASRGPVYGDFYSDCVVCGPPRRRGRVERALREAGRRIRLAAKMLAVGETGDEYDAWDE